MEDNEVFQKYTNRRLRGFYLCSRTKVKKKVAQFIRHLALQMYQEEEHGVAGAVGAMVITKQTKVRFSLKNVHCVSPELSCY